MTFDYYKAPSQEVFDEIKLKAIEVWKQYDNTYGYVDEKVNRIKDLKNISDNAWCIVAMFDIHNQFKLFDLVNEETKKVLRNLFIGNYQYLMK